MKGAEMMPIVTLRPLPIPFVTLLMLFRVFWCELREIILAPSGKAPSY